MSMTRAGKSTFLKYNMLLIRYYYNMLYHVSISRTGRTTRYVNACTLGPSQQLHNFTPYSDIVSSCHSVFVEHEWSVFYFWMGDRTRTSPWRNTRSLIFNRFPSPPHIIGFSCLLSRALSLGICNNNK